MSYGKISNFIYDQFPDIYKENGEGFIAFVEAYYEYLENNYGDNKNFLENLNVDETLNEYLVFFKKTYLSDFPYVSFSDKRFLVKNILDFYKSKGSALSSELLIKLLFGDSSKIYYPSENIFTLSDSKWYVPEYIEVESKKENYDLIGQTVYGSRSKTSAIVEGVVTKRINGKYIDVIYISNSNGFFVTKEYIVTENGVIKNSPTVLGSLTNITITNGGKDTKIGDVFDVESINGKQGKARVKKIENSTGRVEFSIQDGGFGFTTTNDTDIKISDAILSLKNNLMEFIDGEKVYQKIEKLNVLSTGGKEAQLQIGKTVIGVDSANNQLCSGNIIKSSITNNTGIIDVIINNGTFNDQQKIYVNSNLGMVKGDFLYQEKELNFTFNGNVNSLSNGYIVTQKEKIETFPSKIKINYDGNPVFNVGDRITQYNANNVLKLTSKISKANSTHVELINITYHNGANSVNTGIELKNETSNSYFTISNAVYGPRFEHNIKYTTGKIKNIVGNTVYIKECWGNFLNDKNVYIYDTSNNVIEQGTITNVTITQDSAFAEISAANSSVLNIFNINGDFSVGEKVSNMKGSKKATITNIENGGAANILLENNTLVVLDGIEDISAFGEIIGQNTSSIGIYGNNYSFYTSSNAVIPNTNRIIDSAFLNNSSLEVTTVINHNYMNSDYVKLYLDIENDTGVYNISGIYEIKSIVNSKTFTIDLENIYVELLEGSSYNVFDNSNVEKIFNVYIKTQRENMFNPRLDSNGEIINVTKTVLNSYTGFDASFEIKELESEDVIFIKTDLIKDENNANIPFLSVKLNGSNSGIGFVENINVINGGSGYSNGQFVTFVGGGYANGEPENTCVATINTDINGSIMFIEITDGGSGYWSEPQINLPITTGVNAQISLDMQYGYGFPKNPLGNKDTLLKDLLDEKQMTIGKISELYKINPGDNYNTSPFIKVFNKYVNGYNRSNIMIELNVDTNYKIGETVYQLIDGFKSYKGVVINVENNYITLERNSFSVTIDIGENLYGEESSFNASVVDFYDIKKDNVMGYNANIIGQTISANGIVKEIEIIDSGFGYEDLQEVVLTKKNYPYLIDGISKIQRHGKGQGYWLDSKSHASGVSKLRDSDYYQEFSYEVVTNRSLDKYEKILKKMIHVSGTKMFGRVENENYIEVKNEVNELSEITITQL